MKWVRAVLGVLALLSAAPLAGCASDTAKEYTWQAPAKLTSARVFDACLQTMSQMGAQVVSSDRQSGVLSATRHVGEVGINLNVSISGQRPVVVRTTSTWSSAGGFATPWLLTDTVKEFHQKLFARLGITDPNDQRIDMTGG